MEVLEGIIFYFACGLDPYLQNREPREFQYLRTLVDGAHWQGQKRLRRPDRNGSGGHLGCSGKASKFLWLLELNLVNLLLICEKSLFVP